MKPRSHVIVKLLATLTVLVANIVVSLSSDDPHNMIIVILWTRSVSVSSCSTNWSIR